jgi:hypothetical protein
MSYDYIYISPYSFPLPQTEYSESFKAFLFIFIHKSGLAMASTSSNVVKSENKTTKNNENSTSAP